MYWTIYSATTFLERCRKGVWKIWFEKSGLRNLVREKMFLQIRFFFWFEKSGWPEKKVVLYYKSTFFQVEEKWLTRKKKSEFEEPLF